MVIYRQFQKIHGGREYIYEYPSRRTQKYDLYTLGADGIEGGSGEDADVGNWMQQ